MGGDSRAPLASPSIPAHPSEGHRAWATRTLQGADAGVVPEWRSISREGGNSTTVQGVESRPDGPPRMVKRPTGSGGEPSSPNCGASAGGKARQLLLVRCLGHRTFPTPIPHPMLCSPCLAHGAPWISVALVVLFCLGHLGCRRSGGLAFAFAQA